MAEAQQPDRYWWCCPLAAPTSPCVPSLRRRKQSAILLAQNTLYVFTKRLCSAVFRHIGNTGIRGIAAVLESPVFAPPLAPPLLASHGTARGRNGVAIFELLEVTRHIDVVNAVGSLRNGSSGNTCRLRSLELVSAIDPRRNAVKNLRQRSD